MKNMRKLLVFMTILSVILIGCQSQDVNNSQESVNNESQISDGSLEEGQVESAKLVKVIDAEGRELVFEEPIERVVCIGPGALRLYTYIMGSDKLVGVEDIDKTPEPKKPYLIAYPEIMELDTIGPGGPKNSPDLELLTYAQPDVIFSLYSSGPEDLDQMQNQIGCNVVALSLGRNSVFEEETHQSLEIIGLIMSKEDRAKDLISYMKDIQKDLNTRTANTGQGPDVYIGGIGYRGSQGILSTRSNFALLDNINANNVMDEISNEANIMIDKEKLLEINPEIIFLDLDGQDLIEEDMKEDPDFYGSLQAFKNNNAYGIMPYNNYQTNIDTALIDMYYMGSIVHPQAFEGMDIDQVAEEIYTKLLGTNVQEQMRSIYPKAYENF